MLDPFHGDRGVLRVLAPALEGDRAALRSSVLIGEPGRRLVLSIGAAYKRKTGLQLCLESG